MRRLSSRGTLKIYTQREEPILHSGNDVTKGVAPDMKSKLDQLYMYKDETVDQLPVSVQSLYNSVVSYAKLVHGTEDYDSFYNHVQSVFGRSSSFSPGTIGAYFAGCIVATNLDASTQKCSVLCVGALPPPKSKEMCSHSVYLVTEVNSTEHEIKKISSGSGNANAIVYIKSISKKGELSENDISTLKSGGVQNISIYLSSVDYTTYAPVTNGFVSIDTVLSPPPVQVELNEQESDAVVVPLAASSVVVCSTSNQQTSVMSSGTVIAIVVIIIIIVLLILVIAAEFYYPWYFPQI